MRPLPFPATEYISLSELKQHVRIIDDDSSEDAYLETLLAAALLHTSNAINREIYPFLQPPDTDTYPNAITVEEPLLVASKMLVSTWYDVRETVVIGVSVTNVPIAFDLLVQPYRVLQTGILSDA